MTDSENPVQRLRQALEAGEHLPSFLRDFHDQKDVFKAVQDWATKRSTTELPEGMPNWITAHCYTIDWFLRFMAAHGYTLQRWRLKSDFASLAETISDRRERETEALKSALAEMKP